MLFISILLSVWFSLWVVWVLFVKRSYETFLIWLSNDYETDDEDIDPLLEKSEGKGVYHLNCDHCNHIWWSIEPWVNYCPFCGKRPHDTKL